MLLEWIGVWIQIQKLQGLSNPERMLPDSRTVELASRLNTSFVHVLCSTNEDVDLLPNEGIRRSSLSAVSFPLHLV